MKFNEFDAIRTMLKEALKPSEYRSFVKNWDKGRYKDIFTNPKYEHDRNGYRVFIPIEWESALLNRIKNSYAYDIVERELEKIGYDVEDYIKGLAVMKNNRNRKVKIGKLLKDKGPVYMHFMNDENRQSTQREHEVVISRHPYDIAGMSTDRGWTSCMNLKDGSRRRYVPMDVKYGTVIAYAIRKGDRNIQNPVARVLIKPFLEVTDDKSKEPSVFFGIENNVYGEEPPGFVDSVNDWVDEINDKRTLDNVVSLKLHPDLYIDSKSDRLFIRKGKGFSEEDQIKIVTHDPFKIHEIDNPSEKVQLAAIKKDPMFIGIINNLTDKMAQVAVTINGLAIMHIDNPSKKLQEIAIKQNVAAIRYIKNPSLKMQQYAIGVHPQLIRNMDITTLPEELIITALENDGSTLQYVKEQGVEITDKMALTAIKNDAHTIKYVDNQTYEMQNIAIEDDPTLIAYCKKPVKPLMRKAVEANSSAITFIKLPPKDIQMIAIKDNPNLAGDIRVLHPDVLFYAIKKAPTIIGYPSIRSKLTDEMKEFIIRRDPNDIMFMENPSEELQLIAVKKDPDTFKIIQNLATDEVRIEALKRNGDLIRHIAPSKQTEEMQIIAIKNDIYSYNHIYNPSEKVKKLYDKLIVDRRKVAEEYA